MLDLVEQHRSTIVFANSRRLAERLTARLNELAYERRYGQTAQDLSAYDALDGGDSGVGAAPPDRRDGGAEAPPGGWAPGPRQPGGMPAAVSAQAGTGDGAPVVVARAHHGSVSREQRTLVEEELKSGRLPAVVATSSLELGIDMGAVDLVVQVEAPPSVATGLQRVGRAGHQVGAVSRGVLFPKYRGDLVESAVVAERMQAGQIEAMRYPRNPLDVLAQQVVAMVAMDAWTVDELAALVRGAAPFAELPTSALESVLDMLSGRYPSDEFAELRPRLVWDRVTGTLTGRPGAQRLAVTSGGTIPDRGLFGVFLAAGAGEPGRRVGELDEEMVYESRVGDVFLLGSTSWRIEDITHDRVLVSPAPGQPGKMPFWKGDAPGRPVELGRALGAFLREVSSAPAEKAAARAKAAGLDDWGTANLLAYLAEQQEATRHLPDDRTLLVERFRDELGDWRLVVHSPFGAPVNAPWALAITARLRERYGVDAQVDALRRRDRAAAAGDRRRAALGRDRAVRAGRDRAAGHRRGRRVRAVRVPVPGVRGPGAAAAAAGPAPAHAAVAPAAAGGAPAPGRQRLRVVPDRAGDHARVPAGRLRRARAGRDHVATCGRGRSGWSRSRRRSRPRSPGRCCSATSARSCTRGTRRWPSGGPQALSLDTALLAELLGQAELRELLDADAVAEVEAQLQWLTEDRRAYSMDSAADLLRLLGDLTTAEALARGATPAWLAELEAARRAIRVRIAGAGALDRDRGRRPGPGRARRAAADRGAGGVHRAGAPTRSATSSRGTPGRTGRSTPPTARAGSGSASRWWRRRWSGWRRPAGWRPASSGPAGPGPSGATPRCCACCAGGRWPSCARRSSRCRSRRWPGSCRPGRASGRGPAVPTGCCGWSSSWPGRRCRPRRWRRWCCRPGWPTTRPRCWTS